MNKHITVTGARTHNLKNVTVSLPRNQLVVITGLSGSGKSSLAFDTLFAEGQRRYLDSLPAYVRQFLSTVDKPDVDRIDGLSPTISIEQKSGSHNPRSTVGTVTEIYDYLRLLFSRVGAPHCPKHGQKLLAQSVDQMADSVLQFPEGTRIMVLAPVVRNRKGAHMGLFNELTKKGFERFRIDGQVVDVDARPALDPKCLHTIEVVIDRLKVRPQVRLRLIESFELALSLTQGICGVDFIDSPPKGWQDTPLPIQFSNQFACTQCGYSITEMEPSFFSFNSPLGACHVCDGLGSKQFFDPEKVVPDPDLSLADGAINWFSRNIEHYDMLQLLSEHYQVDIHKPFALLPESIKQLIFYGTSRKPHFQGVLTHMEKRYQETGSQSVREHLAQYITYCLCPDCGGTRLTESARQVWIQGHNLPEISAMSIKEVLAFFEQLQLSDQSAEIAQSILVEIKNRLLFLVSVGLDYLSLNRSANTLSGGEVQRIRLARQIGSGLMGVVYVLDEPSIGLHQRDNQRLLTMLMRLRDLGNTVVMVEHDEEAIRQSDHVIDVGPGPGVHGGQIVAQGTPDMVAQTTQSLTGQYLSGVLSIPIPKQRHRSDPQRQIRITGCACNNLKSVDVDIPIGLFTCVTGVSGSGKSSLINDTLYPLAARQLNRSMVPKPQAVQSITGLDLLDKVIDIDQSPIGRTPRSNPGTYTGVFGLIRELFAATPEARSRGYGVGRFSFNADGGRCTHCQGDGLIKVKMHFLADIYVVCDVCHAKRYNRETLEITYKGKNIDEVLHMTIEEALAFFHAIPLLKKKLTALSDVGLGYIQIGQNATTLSGGEAQRLKLAKELSRASTGKTLYILDEPTTGLHIHDVKQLLSVLHRLRDYGNTVVVIEHNLDVIKTADWVIDLGPEGGKGGGEVLVSGPPEQVADHPSSHTGIYLKALLRK